MVQKISIILNGIRWLNMRRIKLKRSMIQNEILVCPYCMDEKSQDDTGCCHETSAHFETAYVTQDEIYLASQIEIEND